ncbi:MAG: hypothetical protein RID91_21395 [Azospirillaceae bacterium]
MTGAAPDSAGDDAAAAVDAFVARHAGASDADPRARVVALFHAVRALPYASTGVREPAAVLAAGAGSCTGKHMVLRDALRRIGERAEVEIVEGDFAAAIPVVAGMSSALARWTGRGGIRDYHNRVIWHAPEGEVVLDATWPDAVARFGFAVNADWRGRGDTATALAVERVHGRPEDTITEKQALIETLPPRLQADRRAFLALLTDWLAGVQGLEARGRNAKGEVAAHGG